MTDFQRHILAAIGPDWRTAQEILQRMPIAYRYRTDVVTPRLGKLERLGLVERDTEPRWHRWRLI